MESDLLKHSHWRKSGQWMGLNRKHALLVVNDTLAKDAFREYAPHAQSPQQVHAIEGV